MIITRFDGYLLLSCRHNIIVLCRRMLHDMYFSVKSNIYKRYTLCYINSILFNRIIQTLFLLVCSIKPAVSLSYNVMYDVKINFKICIERTEKEFQCFYKKSLLQQITFDKCNDILYLLDIKVYTI